ncbi:MAG: N-acetylmuramoyl-L-alanine amidase, partial [Candidatus Omnitrophica bacterium]|nr:N-acetylmuramoyl-L-alanine amidase [Candidatus Omnitrophota bacterium]
GIVGNFSERMISDTQFDALIYLVKTLEKRYGIPANHVMGHSDVPGTATECPGKKFPWTRFRSALR